MNRKRCVVVGFLGKLPYGGMSWYNLNPIVGLLDLGYEIHYLETVDYPEHCYNPRTGTMTSDPSYAIEYIRDILPHYGCADVPFSVVNLERRCYGASWPELREALAQSDFILTLGTPSWLDEFELCRRRVFFDTDPMFTQVEMLEGGLKASVVPRYDTLLSQCTRFGKPDCLVPDLGRSWLPMLPPIATRLWEVAPEGDPSSPVTGLLHWAAGSDLTHEGRTYGHKNREFQAFLDLPLKTSQPMALAVDGRAPRSRLRELGWRMLSPLDSTEALPRYRQFIADARADFGVAKHAYVATRCGWFSDRGACYLASGRPVLHQDTGFTDWLPAGEGVLLFSNPDDVLESIKQLNADYPRQVRAARRIAEEYLEATTVLGRMLDAANLR